MPDHPIPDALTFEDVTLAPRPSEVLPKDVDVATRCSRNIRCGIPVVSAAMDTVTEAGMAIAMAQSGGLGFIHRNLSIEEQATEVDKVKRSESGMIVHPITMSPEDRIATALEVMQKYRISGLPVTDSSGKLLGILTNRDLRFATSTESRVSDLMTKERLITVPVGTTLEEAKALLHKHRIEKLLVVDDRFHLKGLITVKDIKKTIKYPNATKDSLGRLRVGAAVGTSPDTIERAEELVKAHADVVCIDTAHGHSRRVLDMLRVMRARFPELEIVVGNVATEEGARDLVQLGADAVKVGIGPGSTCTTRIVTGVGIPQITAILNCSRVTREAGIPLIADGGVRYSGDITKALAAGADCVMCGALLAGTEESPGETILYQGRSFKSYRGMGSLGAMSRGSRDRYFQDLEGSEDKMVPEGIEGRVPYRGPVADMLFQLVGGVKSGMGYCGARNVPELQREARFLRVTAAGLRESHVHDIIITKESPNYRVE